MKKIAFILAFIFVSSSAAFAQKRSDLQGPAYKNYKPWKHKTESKSIYSVSKEDKVTGPAYKNQKPWKKTSENTSYTAVNFGSERSKLEGPAYKNFKPWRKNDEKDNSDTYIAENDSI